MVLRAARRGPSEPHTFCLQRKHELLAECVVRVEHVARAELRPHEGPVIGPAATLPHKNQSSLDVDTAPEGLKQPSVTWSNVAVLHDDVCLLQHSFTR